MTSPVADAIDAALRGELIVLPTDTVYGIGTRPDQPEATAAVFAAKGRPTGLALPVLAPSLRSVARLARLDERAERLALELWPGALTIVLPRTSESRGWDLGGDVQTIGVRVPDHPLALAVLTGTGPLAITSANRWGSPTPLACDEVQAVFGGVVSVYLCDEVPRAGRASTVVDLAHGEPAVLRPGAVDERTIARALAG